MPRPPTSTVLLSQTPPTFSAPVQLSSHSLHTSQRHLELRSTVLLFYKPSTPNPYNPSSADKLIPLHAKSNPRPSGAATALLTPPCALHTPALHPPLRLRFRTPALRDAFLRTATQVTHHLATAPTAYLPLRELGHGAAAVVYLVRHAPTRRLYALKALPKHAALSPHHLPHVVSERTFLAHSASPAPSPFLPSLQAAFETSSTLCLVTHVAAYGSLRAIAEHLPDHRVPEPVARFIFAELLLALADVHRQGYLHRDVKLGNVLLSSTGHVQLADFGLAKRVDIRMSDCTDDESCDNDAYNLLGKAMSFVGTKRYMSPEIVAGDRGYGSAADVWALGVLLYVLLVGDYPFGRQTSKRAGAIYEAIETEPIEYPSWLSEDAVDLLTGLLDRDEVTRLGTSELKRHAWMRGIDFRQMRKDASKDVPRKEVIQLLRQHRVPRLDEVQVGIKSLPIEDVFSDVSAGHDGSRKRRSAGTTSELLGFGFVPQNDS